uniref:Uncharacterized protein n=1 Tax=Rhizophora mucronata TaxID=61149 RepID=A0A2P2PSJ5_RHIMU
MDPTIYCVQQYCEQALEPLHSWTKIAWHEKTIHSLIKAQVQIVLTCV